MTNYSNFAFHIYSHIFIYLYTIIVIYNLKLLERRVVYKHNYKSHIYNFLCLLLLQKKIFKFLRIQLICTTIKKFVIYDVLIAFG